MKNLIACGFLAGRSRTRPIARRRVKQEPHLGWAAFWVGSGRTHFQEEIKWARHDFAMLPGRSRFGPVSLKNSFGNLTI